LVVGQTERATSNIDIDGDTIVASWKYPFGAFTYERNGPFWGQTGQRMRNVTMAIQHRAMVAHRHVKMKHKFQSPGTFISNFLR